MRNVEGLFFALFFFFLIFRFVLFAFFCIILAQRDFGDYSKKQKKNEFLDAAAAVAAASDTTQHLPQLRNGFFFSKKIRHVVCKIFCILLFFAPKIKNKLKVEKKKKQKKNWFTLRLRKSEGPKINPINVEDIVKTKQQQQKLVYKSEVLLVNLSKIS